MSFFRVLFQSLLHSSSGKTQALRPVGEAANAVCFEDTHMFPYFSFTTVLFNGSFLALVCSILFSVTNSCPHGHIRNLIVRQNKTAFSGAWEASDDFTRHSAIKFLRSIVFLSFWVWYGRERGVG